MPSAQGEHHASRRARMWNWFTRPTISYRDYLIYTSPMIVVILHRALW